MSAASRDRSSSAPGLLEPAWRRRYELVSPLWSRLWPGTFRGLENIPDGDAFILVANHSGLGVAECVTIIAAWLEAFPEVRPLAAMAHSGLFRVPLMGDALRGFGAIEATRAAAKKARDSGRPLLLFPGGDHESMRPLWRSHDVDFNGRSGFVRLAREHGLTIVPLAIKGSHVTLPNLGTSRWMAWVTGARVIGMRRAPLPVSSLVFAALAAMNRGRSPARRALDALLLYWAGALIPWVPAQIEFVALPPITSLDAPDDDISRQVVASLTRELRAR